MLIDENLEERKGEGTIGWEMRCTVALVRPCQSMYTCGSRWTFAHLLHCMRGIAGYTFTNMMSIDGFDGGQSLEIPSRKPVMMRTNTRLLNR
jgi:hypothetical protein